MENDIRHIFYFLLKLFHVNFDKFSFILLSSTPKWANQVVQVVKNLLASAGDTGDVDLMSELRRSPVGGNGNPLQYYSCLENPMDRGARWATVHGSQRVRHD